MHCKRQKNSRTGFSLVELLVVIAIIAVLVAFMTVAVMSALGNARVQATQALIKKVDGLLRQRIEAFNRFDFNSKFGWATTQKLSEADSIQNRAKVLARKWLFQRYFPQTWYEVQQAGLITQTELTTIQNEMAQSGSTAAESSEVLYFILTQSDLIGYSAEGIDEFKSNEVRDTGCSLRPEFIDAWGQPLRFYRWPTRLIRPGGYGSTPTGYQLSLARILMPALPKSASTELALDPDDLLGLTLPTSSPAWSVSPATFEYNSSNPQTQSYHTAGTYHTPMVLSIGPDGDLGLYEPNSLTQTSYGYLARPIDEDANNNGTLDSGEDLNNNNQLDLSANALYDNITNLNMKSGGK